MTAGPEVLRRPAAAADHWAPSPHGRAGIAIALGGLAVLAVGAVATVVAGFLQSGGSGPDVPALRILAWSAGLDAVGVALVLVGIAAIIIGIVYRLRMRFDALVPVLRRLRPAGHPVVETGDVRTPWGKAMQGAAAPVPSAPHVAARRFWAPMAIGGVVLVAVGFVVSLGWAAQVTSRTVHAAEAWVHGLASLGLGLVLAGVGLLLFAVLGTLRDGGGEVQASLGVTVRTLRMPVTATLAAGAMALGLAVSVLQFFLHVAAAQVSDGQSFVAWLAWLGPTRQLGLGLVLAGIVLALVAVGDLLTFQHDRYRQALTSGS